MSHRTFKLSTFPLSPHTKEGIQLEVLTHVCGILKMGNVFKRPNYINELLEFGLDEGFSTPRLLKLWTR